MFSTPFTVAAAAFCALKVSSRADSVEIRMVGIETSVSLANSSVGLWLALDVGESIWLADVGTCTPLVDASSSASTSSRVTAEMSTCAFCILYSSSITKTALRVLRSSSHPICDTSRVSSA